MVAIGEPARITYTNYRGETAERTITPKRVWFGISDWHPVPQWFLTAFDHDKNGDRDFALRDFGSTNLGPGLEAAARWHEEEAERKRTISVKSRRLGAQIATHQLSAAALRALSPSPDHAEAGKVEGDGRADLERFWRPISEADRSITFEKTFEFDDGKSMTIRNSDDYWVRDADGRVYKATWSDQNAGYWWDIEAESPVDPIEYMPHPLSLSSAPTQEVAGS
nr:hypothetical protein [Brucella anthropi]